MIGELYVKAGNRNYFFPTDNSWQYRIGGTSAPEKYTANAPSRGAGGADSHRADQPERMGTPDGSNAAFDRAVSRLEGAEGDFEAGGGRVRQRDDDTEDIENDDYEDVEEDEGFDISM